MDERCSLARLLFGLAQAQFTGAIRVIAPVDGSEEKHELFLRLGRIVHVRHPHLDEPLGHILRDMGLLDHETYARSLMAMAQEHARHGTVLKRMGIVNDEQVAGAIAVQVLRRSARMFRLRGGRFSIDPYDHEHGRPEDGAIAARGVGVRRVIYNGVCFGYEETDLVWELNLLAGRQLRMRRDEARRLGRYGFGPEARATLELLWRGFSDLQSLLGAATNAAAAAAGAAAGAPAGIAAGVALLKVLYTLLVTEMIEVEEVGALARIAEPSRPTPPGLDVTPAPVPRSAPPAGAAPASARAPQRTPSQPPAPRSPNGVRRAVAPTTRGATGVHGQPTVAPTTRGATGVHGGPGLPVAEPRPVVPAARGASLETLQRFRKGSRPPGQARHDEPDPRALEASARFLRGEAYLRKGDVEMALANLKAAANLQPDDPDVLATLALATWRDHREPEESRSIRARRLLAHAVGLAPRCSRAYRVFGTVYGEQGEVDQAIRCFAKVIELVPGDVEASRELKRLDKRRHRPSLLSLFRRS
jgi:tetratricopeptide (TPR) repeat protein